MITLNLTRGKDLEGIYIRLPAPQEKIEEAIARLDVISEDTATTRILNVSSSVKNLGDYIQNTDLSQPGSLQKVAALAEKLQPLDLESCLKFEGMLDANMVQGVDDVMKLADCLDEYVLLPEVGTGSALGRYLVNQGAFECPDHLRPYLDYQAIGQECIRGSYSATVSSFGSKALRLFNFLYLLKPAAKRLEDVVIENKNAITLIKDEKRPGTFFYCDPPYFEAENLYEVKMNKRFHVRLWMALSSSDGRFLLSYNDCPFIRQLYKNYYILAVTRNNPLKHQADATYEELFITNYDPAPYLNVQLSCFERITRSKGELVLIHTPVNQKAA